MRIRSTTPPLGFVAAVLLLTGPLSSPTQAQCGDPGAGDCRVAHETPYCDDAACCDVVCGFDDFCCENEWDTICVDEATLVCPPTTACGQVGSGACDTANGTIACEDLACCQQVCLADEYCCLTEWDEICAGAVPELCTIVPTPTGACCFADDLSCDGPQTEAACFTAGGTYKGADTVCAEVDCRQHNLYATDDPFGSPFGLIGFDVSTSQTVGLRFTPQRRYVLDRVSVWFMNNDDTGGHPTVTLSLRTDTDTLGYSHPSGVVLESWTFPVSAVGWNPVKEVLDSVLHPTLSASQNYWLVAESSSEPLVNGVWNWAGIGSGYTSTIDHASSNDWQVGGEGAVVAVEILGTLSTESVGACCAGGACAEVLESACTGFVCSVADHLPQTFTGCYGDADGNGFVNAGDRGFVAAAIGQTAPELICTLDMDGNGFINAGDRGFIAAEIGLCSPLPDWQNGSGLNRGVPDARFGAPTFTPETGCDDVVCPS